MKTFKDYLKSRLDELADGQWSAERAKFFGTYTGENEQKAIQAAEAKWGSLAKFLHDQDEKKWARLWVMVRGSEGA